MAASSQKGNALVFILIAVFLLGALTVLMMRSGGQTEETGATEQSTIAAASTVRYFSGLESVISGLQSRGCSESQISFQNDIEANAYYKSEYASTPTPADKSCMIFQPAGAGITYKSASTLGGTALVFTGGAIVENFGTTARELVAILTNVSLAQCLALNKIIGINNPSGAPPAIGFSVGVQPFKGNYNPTANISVTGQTGKKSACVSGNSASGSMPAGQYSFYYALIKR